MMAETAYFHSNRIARYRMMPPITKASAFRPLVTSSCPTCGPTNSTRRSVTSGLAAFSSAITLSLCSADVTPCLSGRRIITSRDEPKFCTSTSW